MKKLLTLAAAALLMTTAGAFANDMNGNGAAPSGVAPNDSMAPAGTSSSSTSMQDGTSASSKDATPHHSKSKHNSAINQTNGTSMQQGSTPSSDAMGQDRPRTPSAGGSGSSNE